MTSDDKCKSFLVANSCANPYQVKGFRNHTDAVDVSDWGLHKANILSCVSRIILYYIEIHIYIYIHKDIPSQITCECARQYHSYIRLINLLHCFSLH